MTHAIWYCSCLSQGHEVPGKTGVNGRQARSGERLTMLRTMLFAALLIVVPALCMAGVLLHPCPSDGTSSCAHEMLCSSDPCGEDLLRPTPVKHSGPTEAVPCAPAATGVLPSHSPETAANVQWTFASRLRLPHTTDVPLRI